jgi:hypothetical protein
MEEKWENLITTSAKEKCTKQLAQNAAKTVKFLSNLQKTDLSFVEIVTRRKDQKDFSF